MCLFMQMYFQYIILNILHCYRPRMKHQGRQLMFSVCLSVHRGYPMASGPRPLSWPQVLYKGRGRGVEGWGTLVSGPRSLPRVEVPLVLSLVLSQVGRRGGRVLQSGPTMQPGRDPPSHPHQEPGQVVTLPFPSLPFRG